MSIRREQFEKYKDYIVSEGLDSLVPFEEHIDFEEGVYDAVSGQLAIPFPPEPADLVRLHQLVRGRAFFTVLEFGTGYSTAVIADALAKNEKEWNSLNSKPEIRNRFMFQLFSVDASTDWIQRVQARIPSELTRRIHWHHSTVQIGTWQGRLCHFYETLPDVVADFYYLDGPAPKDVQGSFNGLSFQCDERTVMSADLLVMEPTMLPGTVILVDGRTNNARFLAANFQRSWRVKWMPAEDVTIFHLDEPRLGKYNVLGADYLRKGVDSGPWAGPLSLWEVKA